jgi:glycosyltransferase involved in cell wall biosynthesis
VAAMSCSEGERLIVVGPTPPPIHGVSVVTSLLLRALQRLHLLAGHLDTTDERPLDNLGRLDFTNVRLGIQQAYGLTRLLAIDREAAVYLPLAPSRWGFLRDALLIAIARLWRRPVYVHLHGGTGVQDLYSTAGPVSRRVIRATTTSVHQVWALTPSLAADCAFLFPHDAVKVLENVADDPLDGLSPGKPGEPALEGRRGGFRILYLSNLLPEKGCMDLLEAIERLGPVAEGWHIRIVGDAPTAAVRVAMTEMAASLGTQVRVELPGVAQGEEKGRDLRWADIFVLPSRYQFEGQPHAILEALAAGLPVVSTWHSGIPDTVRDGQEGLLVPPGDTEALANALVRLAADPTLRSELGQRARKRYESRYTPSRLDGDLSRLLRNGSLDAEPRIAGR